MVQLCGGYGGQGSKLVIEDGRWWLDCVEVGKIQVKEDGRDMIFNRGAHDRHKTNKGRQRVILGIFMEEEDKLIFLVGEAFLWWFKAGKIVVRWSYSVPKALWRERL